MLYTGSCLCQKIQFQIEAKSPLPFGHCHCCACRKSHGADHTSATIIGEQQLELLQGRDSLAIYQSSNNMQRQFCQHCGSRLFVRFIRKDQQGERVFYTVAINTLDKLDQWRETAHIYTAHKAPWIELTDDLPKAAENFPPKA